MLPKINPPKRVVIAKGITLSNSLINKKPINIPKMPPTAIGNKYIILFLKLLFILAIASKILLYILNIIAIVAPLIPGTITASPIKKPARICLKVFPYKSPIKFYAIKIS